MRKIQRFGWIPDLPDQRDLKFMPTVTHLPETVDWRPQMPAVYDQGELGSCTANGTAGALEFLQGSEKETEFTPSRLFIYWNTRNIEGSTSTDSGAQVRDAIKAAVACGACPETDWPYNVAKFADKPPVGAYNAAKTFELTGYRRVTHTLAQIKAAIVTGPVVFGFTVYDSFEGNDIAKTGIMPMPAKSESVIGGHCVVAVGYITIKNVPYIICRNSWGADWGDKGYFYMPAKYIASSLASDFWVLTKTT